jgi:hypothetical protein
MPASSKIPPEDGELLGDLGQALLGVDGEHGREDTIC